MKFITIEELKELEIEANVINNGISGQDGSSNWFTVREESGNEYDVYVNTEEMEKY